MSFVALSLKCAELAKHGDAVIALGGGALLTNRLGRRYSKTASLYVWRADVDFCS